MAAYRSKNSPAASVPSKLAEPDAPASAAPPGLLTQAALQWLAQWRVPVVLVPYVLLRAWNLYFLGINQDVKRYFDAATAWLSGRVPYSQFPLEYPPGALPFFALPRLFASTLQDATGPVFSRWFAAEMVVFDVAIMGVIAWLSYLLMPQTAATQADDTPRRGWLTVAQLSYVMWTGSLGYLAFERYDLVFAGLIVAWLAQALSGKRRFLTDGLLAISIWVKIVSVVYLPIYLAFLYAIDSTQQNAPSGKNPLRRWVVREGAVRAACVLGGAALLFAPFYYQAGDEFFNFLRYHSDRGLQIESTGSSILLLLRHTMGLQIGTRFAYGATEVVGPGVAMLAQATGGIMLAVAGAITWVTARALVAVPNRATVARIFVRGVMALSLGLLVTNKVFSPQYMLWLAPLVAAVILAQGPTMGHDVLGLFVANTATGLILFFYYINLLQLEAMPMALLVTRNAIIGGLAAAFTPIALGARLQAAHTWTMNKARAATQDPYLAYSALALCGAWVFCANLSETTANDIWIQLRSGEDIWRSWKLPYTEVYSATVSGRPFIAHEWLSGVLFYASTLVFGDAGLSVMTAVVALAIFVCMYFTFVKEQRQRIYYLPALLYLNYLVAFRLLARPHIFTILAQAGMIMAIERWRRTGRASTLIALIPMQLVWINLHGAALFGPALMAMVCGLTWAMVVIPRLGKTESRRMGARDVWVTGAITAGMCAACVINPYGSRIVTFSLDLLGNEYAKNRVWEWTTPFLPMNTMYYWLWIFMAGLALVWSALLVRLHTLPLLDIAYTVLATYLGVRANRFMPDFALLAFPVILRSLDYLCTRGLKPTAWRQQPWLNLGLATLLICNCFTYGYAHSAREHRPMLGWGYGGDMPYEEVALLKSLNIRGVIYNEYSDGSLVINQLWPNIKPVLDSRIDLYPLDFVAEYDQAYVQAPLFARFLDQHHVDVVMLYKHRVPPQVVQYLAGNPTWRLLSESPSRVLYVTRRALARGLASRRP